ncbi:MAG: DUF2892 domain-containing protein [Candidatus Doudnabacteria bacterium]|nr:DUF2892 domain-containing protein [Candidatus Doudnabacteria bacterium]
MLLFHLYTTAGLFLLAFALGFAYRSAVRKHSHTEVGHRPKNINTSGRVLRAGIGLVLLIAAMVLNWNPVLILASGLSFFQAVFSWCAYYHLVGKDTCPLE